MPAHVRQGFVGDDLHNQADGLTVEIAQPVYLMQGDHPVLQFTEERVQTLLLQFFDVPGLAVLDVIEGSPAPGPWLPSAA